MSHCNTLQHTAIYYNTKQHTAIHGNTHATHFSTHCNTLHRTATHYIGDSLLTALHLNRVRTGGSISRDSIFSFGIVFIYIRLRVPSSPDPPASLNKQHFYYSIMKKSEAKGERSMHSEKKVDQVIGGGLEYIGVYDPPPRSDASRDSASSHMGGGSYTSASLP